MARRSQSSMAALFDGVPGLPQHCARLFGAEEAQSRVLLAVTLEPGGGWRDNPTH
jgi:hypothetical protein